MCYNFNIILSHLITCDCINKQNNAICCIQQVVIVIKTFLRSEIQLHPADLTLVTVLSKEEYCHHCCFNKQNNAICCIQQVVIVIKTFLQSEIQLHPADLTLVTVLSKEEYCHHCC